jgi:hypothetical protein
MQVENASRPDPPAAAAPLDLPEDPQAAIARPQLMAASAIERPRAGLLGTLLALALCMSWEVLRVGRQLSCTGRPVTQT